MGHDPICTGALEIVAEDGVVTGGGEDEKVRGARLTVYVEVGGGGGSTR